MVAGYTALLKRKVPAVVAHHVLGHLVETDPEGFVLHHFRNFKVAYFADDTDHLGEGCTALLLSSNERPVAPKHAAKALSMADRAGLVAPLELFLNGMDLFLTMPYDKPNHSTGQMKRRRVYVDQALLLSDPAGAAVFPERHVAAVQTCLARRRCDAFGGLAPHIVADFGRSVLPLCTMATAAATSNVFLLRRGFAPEDLDPFALDDFGLLGYLASSHRSSMVPLIFCRDEALLRRAVTVLVTLHKEANADDYPGFPSMVRYQRYLYKLARGLYLTDFSFPLRQHFLRGFLEVGTVYDSFKLLDDLKDLELLRSVMRALVADQDHVALTVLASAAHAPSTMSFCREVIRVSACESTMRVLVLKLDVLNDLGTLRRVYGELRAAKAPYSALLRFREMVSSILRANCSPEELAFGADIDRALHSLCPATLSASCDLSE
jgi:hypothetical protein